jgi:hypothetical protein
LASCALVTSGAGILHSGLGPAIDQHQVIVRLNNAPIKGFQQDVGQTTHLRYTNKMTRPDGWSVATHATLGSRGD